MLSIFLLEDLGKVVAQSQSAVLIHCFCVHNDGKRNTAVGVLRTLIFQLLRRHPKMFEHILPSFRIEMEALLSNSSFEALWRIFENMICDPVFDVVYCILDGLDECEKDSLKSLLRKLQGLFFMSDAKSLTHRFSLMIVSRPDCALKHLSMSLRLNLDRDLSSETSADVRLFVDEKVAGLARRNGYTNPLCEYIRTKLLSHAQENFLWAPFVIQALEEKLSSEVEQTLERIPEGLNLLYSHMLLDISEDRWEQSSRILSWVAMAVRPFTLAELSDALRIQALPHLGLSRVDVLRQQTSFCGYLLTINDNKVELGHHSAKGYLTRRDRDPIQRLERFRIDETELNWEIAQKCLDYLDGGIFSHDPRIEKRLNSETDAERLKNFPFAHYAAHHWMEHTRRSFNSVDAVLDLKKMLLRGKSPIRKIWPKSYWNERYASKVRTQLVMLYYN